MFTLAQAADRVLGPIGFLPKRFPQRHFAGSPISSHKEVVTVYCPWLLHYTDMQLIPAEVENSVLNTL